MFISIQLPESNRFFSVSNLKCLYFTPSNGKLFPDFDKIIKVVPSSIVITSAGINKILKGCANLEILGIFLF